MKLNSVDHIAIICSDYQKSKDFYVSILGLKIIREIERPERKSWKCDLDVNGRYQIELFSFPNPPPRSTKPEVCGLRHLAFEVNNLDEAIAELKSKGISTEEIRRDISRNGKRFVFLKDPDGLPIELCEI